MSTYEISKSSLLSLKAEILRKQQELSKVKKDNRVKIQNLKNNTPLDLKNKGVELREANDGNSEDENLLQKSRAALEAKSKLYEKLSKEAGNLSEEQIEENRRYLVCFDKKVSHNENYNHAESDEEPCNEDYDPPDNPDEEWVEYVDCLGRTRTCLRKDLEYLKANDKELKESMDLKDVPREQKSNANNNDEHENKESPIDSIPISEENELLSSDMRRELLRKEWEKEEEALRDKSNIHYQDILFNEARMHGVGYYGFSKDEEERARQQEALKKLRDETQQQQKKAQELRTLREKQLAQRAKAARNRKRARMGLPPEEENEEETKEPAPNEEKPAEVEEEKQKINNEEKERELMRSKYVRPWDIGKKGVKEFQEYTQEEWVDKKRQERVSEFAPPQEFRRDFKSRVTNDIPSFEDKNSLYFSTKKSKDSETKTKRYNEDKPPFKTKQIINEVDDLSSYNAVSESTLLGVNPYKFSCTTSSKNSTMKNKDKDAFTRRYNEDKPSFKATPIINEIDDISDDNSDSDSTLLGINPYKPSCIESNRNKGVEIAPPPTYDYYGPSTTKKPKTDCKSNNVEDSISAGLKYLRQQAEQRQKSNKRDADMFIM